MKIQPFTIHVPQSKLDDLKERLQNTRWPDETKDAGWSSGTNVSYMKELVKYWTSTYDWRKYEAEMNTLPQFTTEVDGVKIHFFHIKSKKENAKAIILTHGWPDSFYRFHKVVPILSEEYDVVVPSMPGFAFSDPNPTDTATVANLWAKLMTEGLGYQSFYAVGGDIGSLVTKKLALKHADVVSGIYLTDVGYPTGMEDQSSMSKAEQEFAGFVQHWWFAEGAYAMVQMTKPQSLAYGLTDSPAGLAAWMISMIHTGSENNHVEEAFGGRDELLTNLTLYWVTDSISSSVRSYAEEAKATYAEYGQAPVKSTVPAAIGLFPREAQFPQEWAERSVNVKRFTKLPKGGHFAPLEVPEIYARDVIDSFKNF